MRGACGASAGRTLRLAAQGQRANDVHRNPQPPLSWAARNREAIKLTRDTVFALLGIFLLLNEALWEQSPRPLFAGVGLILCGLPPALRLDELLRR